jgi:hypothetical protein
VDLLVGDWNHGFRSSPVTTVREKDGLQLSEVSRLDGFNHHSGPFGCCQHVPRQLVAHCVHGRNVIKLRALSAFCENRVVRSRKWMTKSTFQHFSTGCLRSKGHTWRKKASVLLEASSAAPRPLAPQLLLYAAFLIKSFFYFRTSEK